MFLVLRLWIFILFVIFYIALSLNGYRINDSDRTLVVKYAENQQKRKEKKFVYDIASPAHMNSYNPSPLKTVYEMDDVYYYDNNITRIPSNNTAPYSMGDHGYFYTTNEIQRRNYYNKGASLTNPQQLMSSPQSIRQQEENWYQSMPLQVGYDNRSSHTYNNMNPHYAAMSDVSSQPNMKQPQSEQFGHGSVTLMISNLPSHADVASLHDLLSPYGRILNAQIDLVAASSSQPSTGLCSGRGQVQMATLSQAQYAIQALSGTILSEAGQPLQIFLYGAHGHSTERFQNYNQNFSYNR